MADLPPLKVNLCAPLKVLKIFPVKEIYGKPRSIQCINAPYSITGTGNVIYIFLFPENLEPNSPFMHLFIYLYFNP